MMMMSIGVMKMSENEFSATTGRNVISALIPAVSIPSLYLHLKKNFSVVPKCSYWSDCWRGLRKAKKQKCCLLFVWREAVRGPLDLSNFIRAWKQQTCPKTILPIISCVHDQHVPSYTKSTSSLCSVSKVKTFVPVAVKTEYSPKFWNYLIPY